MHFRIHQKRAGRFLDAAKYAIFSDGRIIEHEPPTIFTKEEFYIHDFKEFIVDPWTGYFDSSGKKIYLGDILEMESFFDFKSKIIWERGSFFMEPIDPEGIKNTMGNSGILNGWNVMGNIYGIDFLDK